MEPVLTLHSLQMSSHGRYQMNTRMADYKPFLPMGSTGKSCYKDVSSTDQICFFMLRDRRCMCEVVTAPPLKL